MNDVVTPTDRPTRQLPDLSTLVESCGPDFAEPDLRDKVSADRPNNVAPLGRPPSRPL